VYYTVFASKKGGHRFLRTVLLLKVMAGEKGQPVSNPAIPHHMQHRLFSCQSHESYDVAKVFYMGHASYIFTKFLYMLL
jgi:hypothetical protein